MSSAFISYSRNDRDFVYRLVGDLEKAGISVFFDQRVTPGASWADSISRAIEQANFLLVVLSPDYVASTWAQEEMKVGLEREDQKKALVIPLMVRKCQPPPFIESKAYANFKDSYEVGLSQLISRAQGRHTRKC
jgi:TIR domain